jgi:hypothetical protein
MSTSAQNLDFTGDGHVFVQTKALFETHVGLGQEVQSEPQTTFLQRESDLWLTGMAKVPDNISDVIVNKLQEIAHVKAVLMGRSGEVYHVWTMIDQWNVAGRKAVYTAQKELLLKLKGFDLDFYVVALDNDESPKDMVSDIPTVFQRA